MSNAARMEDLTEGHPPGFPPTKPVSGAKNTFINGKLAIRVDDLWEVHQLPFPPIIPHSPVTAQGSATVFIEGQPASRKGDALSCSDKIAIGSPNVFVGG